MVCCNLVTEAVRLDENCAAIIDDAMNSLMGFRATTQQIHVQTFIADTHASGYYILVECIGAQPQQVYCSVNEYRCYNSGDGNWMRIAYLNMSDPSQ